MQRVSDFYIIDFCEWIKRMILSRSQYSNIDMWDLLFDEKYDEFLMKKAEEYCNREGKQKKSYSNDDIKIIFNVLIGMYYESIEFQDLCCRIRRNKGKYSIKVLFHEFHASFDHFLFFIDKRQGLFNEILDYNGQYITPYVLIDNLRYCYKESLSEEQEQNPILKLMIEGKAIEVEFLEWIQQENIGKEVVEKIDLMPVDVFEDYARRFCEDTGNGVSVKRKLIKSFKRSDSGSLLNKLNRILPFNNAYRKKGLKYVSQRYLTDKAIFKCVLLPLEVDYDKFHELVTKRWKNLNDISGKYLDIYYCFANYGESGHDLMKQLHYLPERFHAKLPCIALWKENMDEAMCIPINELSVDDVYYMIAGAGGIVDLIIEGRTINEIVEGVNDMGEERRNKDRPFIKYVQKANGATNVQQNMVVDGSNVTISSEFVAKNTDSFIKEIAEAMSLVESSELDEIQKNELKSILEEAKESVQKKSDEKASSSKKRFLTFLAFAGNGAQKLIAALAGLSTIAKFFGI